MAKTILKNDAEEYDAKQPPVEKKEDGGKDKEMGMQAKEWQSKIAAIQDEDLARYVADVARAQCDMICAQKRLEGDYDDADGNPTSGTY